MGAFLALTWAARDVVARQDAQVLEARVVAAGGWTSIHRAEGARVWGRGARLPPVGDHGAALVLGTCLGRGGSRPYRLARVEPEASAAALASRFCAEAWGAYVALLADGDDLAIFRDPSGGLDCLTWSLGRVRLTTSDAGPPPAGLLPPRCALNWQAIAGWCFERGRAAVQAGLDGVDVVAPGCLLRQARGCAPQTPIWRPSRFIARCGRRTHDAGEGLVEAVGLAVEGLVRPHARVLAELSGGLDSAIVAAALVERGLVAQVAGCLNYYGDRPEGDERAYARAIAQHLGLPLDCASKPVEPLTAADFAEASQGLRPGFAVVDPVRDRDTAARLRAAGATALVTGHGGDVVFFQMPTPLIAVDQLRRTGGRGISARFIGDLARFTRRPAWSILGALLPRAGGPPPPYRPPGFASGGAPATPWIDPWTGDCAQAPPAKRLQVTGLFRAQLALGWSHRGAEADILHPLLSQPVVEYCLGLATPELTAGGRDRALARRAFRARLPALVMDRRSKGDLTAHYGRVVAASLGFLRPLLLDGRLVEAGLLDRAQLEATLTAERLILHRANSEILVAAVIESWVRWWQTRVPDSPRAPRPR